MIRPTKGTLGTNSTITPEMINNAFYNSPFGAYKKVGAPTFLELQQRRLAILRFDIVLRKVIYD
ncbi:hypothetical protein MUJ57_004611 [Vibrio parahaemolyticus]|nr:hypothetical protein [Vibrio parahaemolyticus]MBE3681434.1 hypothetical protein [Vibrio parahaemolyticus]MBE3682283.1 hypothetical protein [Vibrio parahaemolyticus]HBC3518380.1 hypothetical protein [Vibrio parahaemolyticus]